MTTENVSFQIYRNTVGNLVTKYQDLEITLQTLPETDDSRIRFGVHALVVVYIPTVLGTMVHRGIEVCWSEKYENFYLRFFKKKVKNMHRDLPDLPDRLDVCGPKSKEDRVRWQDTILAFFNQAREQAAAGREFPLRPLDLSRD